MKVELDVLRAETVGKELKKTFIIDRFQNETDKEFFVPIKRQKLMKMEVCNNTALLAHLHTRKGEYIHYTVICLKK